jgi:hypothetical protein
VPALLSNRIDDRFVAAFVVVTLGLFAVVTGLVIYLVIEQANRTSQVASQIAAAQMADDHRWCTTVELLTTPVVGPPADPAANPSRVATYKLYLDFVALKKAFGCP